MIGMAWLSVSDLPTNTDYTFSDYMIQFQKHYEEPELSMRRGIFLTRWEEIQEHNNNPNSTSRMGVNKFTDWTEDERNGMCLDI